MLAYEPRLSGHHPSLRVPTMSALSRAKESGRLPHGRRVSSTIVVRQDRDTVCSRTGGAGVAAPRTDRDPLGERRPRRPRLAPTDYLWRGASVVPVLVQPVRPDPSLKADVDCAVAASDRPLRLCRDAETGASGGSKGVDAGMRARVPFAHCDRRRSHSAWEACLCNGYKSVRSHGVPVRLRCRCR